MTGREAYEIWAPANTMWTEWVRPVPFITWDIETDGKDIINLSAPEIYYVKELEMDTAIILDLPDDDAIKEGLALARLGWRPVPLYNGTKGKQGALAILDNAIIENSLISGAKELKNIPLESNAPPAFLLDSNRTHRHKMNMSVFDNSWDIYSQDMPSADYFLSKGINKIVLRAEKIQRDLRILLYKYQAKGIKIYLSDWYEKPKGVSVKKPLRKHIKMS